MKITLLRSLLLVGAFLCFGWAQAQEVSGTVSDASGPLPGASVVVKGTTNGTQTDFDGNYTLDGVDSNAVLVFSYIGYSTQEVPVNGRSTINVVLEEDAQALDEVVIIGYGQTTVKDATGAVAAVTSDEFNGGVINSPEQLIQGKTAGVNVQQVSGEPGAGIQINIRGANSVRANNNPLFVVDGVPLFGQNTDASGDTGDGATEVGNPLNFLNPNDIESMSILKDASATSIYGSRGANGVVIITTKKGNPGRPKVTANVQTGIANITLDDRNRPPNSPEYLELMREGLINSGRAADVAEANEIIVDNIADTTVNTNWFDELTRQGNTTQANLSVSGGDQRTTYYISAGYFDQDGVILASDFRRLSGKLGLNTQATDWLKFEVNVSANQQRLNTVPDGGAFANPVRSIYRFVPVQPVYNDDGSYNTAINAGFNSVGELNENIRQTNILNLLAGVRATVDLPLKGLSYRPSVNINRIITHDETWENPFFGSGQSGNGEAESDYEEYNDWLVRNQLNYSTYIADAHGIDIQLGHEAQKRTFSNTQTQVSNFAFPNLITLDNGSQPDFINGSKTESTIESIFLNTSYNYQGIVYLNGTVRRDGSSRFGENERYGTFWSVGASVNFHRFTFLEGSPIINTARLRASYGTNGNQEIGNFASRGLYATGEDYNGEPGIILTQLENANLTWEVNKPLNIGIDVGLWNRIDLTLDFYRTPDDYSADRPMYLSEACRTSLGPAVEFRRHAIDDALDETQVLATARFPMRFGNEMLACTHSARLSAGPEPHMDLSLQVNPVNGASAVSITVERSRRDGDYLYVKQGGEKVPVKLDLRYVGTDGREARRVCAADDDTLLENRDGYEAVCVMTGRDQWSVVLPVSPYGPGVTAFWGSTRSPKWYRTSGEPDIVTYHKAVFLPVELGSGEMGVDD